LLSYIFLVFFFVLFLFRTTLRGPPHSQEAHPTQESIILQTGLVLTSIGYKSTQIPGVPWDQKKHIIPNKDGRVIEEVRELLLV
jgi:ferredoxin--NADP+ reductase